LPYTLYVKFKDIGWRQIKLPSQTWISDTAPFAKLHALEDTLSLARTAAWTWKPILASCLHIALCINAVIWCIHRQLELVMPSIHEQTNAHVELLFIFMHLIGMQLLNKVVHQNYQRTAKGCLMLTNKAVKFDLSMF
jgi:hypothetical protein